MSPETKALLRLVIENAGRIDHALRLAADDCDSVAKTQELPESMRLAFEGYAEGFQALRPALEDAVDAWQLEEQYYGE